MLQKVVICGVDTSGLPLLSSKEQEELMLKIKAGDERARERFITGNLRLVLSLVRRFWAKNANADDVFQAGCVGLIKAIDNFDISVGVKFSTYAVPITLARRNSEKEFQMTRKQAILVAKELFTAQNDTKAVEKLEEVIAGMPFVKWAEDTIKDCIEQFMVDFGRLPTVTDFGKNGLPAHPVIKYIFNVPLHEWMTANFPYFYQPELTRRQALNKAVKVLKDKSAIEKIKDILLEYPKGEWTEENINDGIEQFYIEHGHLPREENYAKGALPYIDIFRYKFGISKSEWLMKYFKEIYCEEKRTERIRKSSSLEDFKKEFERIKPFTEDDFDKRRDKERICCAGFIMKIHNINGWHKLLEKCGLSAYKKIVEPKIWKVNLIVI